MTAGFGAGRRVVMLTLDVAVDPRAEREAQALSDEGFDVVILAPEGKPMHEPRFEVERVRISRTFLQRVRRRARAELLALRGVELNGLEYEFFASARSRRPDIVHVLDLPLLRAGVALRHVVGARLVYDIRDWYPEQP